MNEKNYPEIMTIREFVEKFTFMTEASLRWWLFRDSQFRRLCSRKLGKKLFVLPGQIFKYIIEEKNEG